jgi:uncharacterized protein with HEPN domain
MNVEDKASLYDALSAAKKIQCFVRDIDWAGFQASDEKSSAVYGQLVILGEACTRLSLEWRAQYEDIPWRQIVGMRNRIIHGYDEVNWEIVWQVATEHVPRLIDQFSAILDASNGTSENPSP